MAYQKNAGDYFRAAAVLLHTLPPIQAVSRIAARVKSKTRCTITPTPAPRVIVAVPLHTQVDDARPGYYRRGDTIPFYYNHQALMVTMTGKCNSEAVAKSRNFWAVAAGGGYLYSDGPAVLLHT